MLDTFSDQLVNHHQFFLEYLSVSPWCPEDRVVQPPVKLQGEAAQGKGKGKAPPPVISLQRDTGSSRIAQVLGLKFRYYQVRLRWSCSRGRLADLAPSTRPPSQTTSPTSCTS